MIQIEFEKIPSDKNDFIKWAKNHRTLDLRILDNQNRAWCSQLTTLIGDDDCVLYIDGEPSKFIMLKDLKDEIKVSLDEVTIKERIPNEN